MSLQHQNQRLSFTLNSVYIGLAWGEKNLSGFCVLEQGKNKLKILDIKLIKSIDEILNEIQKYKKFKEKMRIKKIPPKVRGYLYTKNGIIS